MIIRMVEFTHQVVDIGRCIPTNFGDKEGNEFWGHVVKHRAMNTDLLQNVPFSEGQDFFRSYKLVKWIFFIGELGESLNIGAQTMSGVEWYFASNARVWVSVTALRAPLARMVFVLMMTLLTLDITAKMSASGWLPLLACFSLFCCCSLFFIFLLYL